MEKKKYIHPEFMVYTIQSASVIATSDFIYGSSGNPSDGRAKLNNIDMSEHYDYDDYFDIDW